MEWQLTGPDEWAFGVKVRGAVRHVVGGVQFAEAVDRYDATWYWQYRGDFDFVCCAGKARTRAEAMAAVEKQAGIPAVEES